MTKTVKFVVDSIANMGDNRIVWIPKDQQNKVNDFTKTRPKQIKVTLEPFDIDKQL